MYDESLTMGARRLEIWLTSPVFEHLQQKSLSPLLPFHTSSALKTSRAARVPDLTPSHCSAFASFSRTKRRNVWSSPPSLFPTRSKHPTLLCVHCQPTYHCDSFRFIEAYCPQYIHLMAINLLTRQIEEVGVLVEFVEHGARSVLDLRCS